SCSSNNRHPPLERPSPSRNIGAVDSILIGVGAASNLRVAEFLLGVPTDALEPHDAVNGINSQTEAINLVIDGQLPWRVDGAFLLVPVYMQALVLSAIS